MKTTHQLAKELLELPDVPFVVEGWMASTDHGAVVKLTDYDPNVAIIMQEQLP